MSTSTLDPKIKQASREYRNILLEMQRRGIALPETFESFIGRVNPTLLDFEHIPKLASVANRVALGILTRVIVMLPPRYLKTETFSRLLAAFFLRQYPWLNTGLVSYGAELAWSISEESRNYYELDGGLLSKDASAKKRWKTHRNGEMWAAGVGGPLLGFGYHLGIVDDPTDPEKVESLAYQRRFREWWPSKFLSRQEPNARIVVVMQRLGMNDPIDFLFRREVGEDTEKSQENWHVVAMDEVKSDEPLGRWKGPRGLPPSCTLEPDERSAGQILAPSRFNEKQVKYLQNTGAVTVAAQRQQRPMRPMGEYWKKGWFRVYDELPVEAYNGGKDWDTAYTKKETNAASAFVESYRGPGDDNVFPIYIENVGWEWLKFPELLDWMQALVGPHYVEAKASGKSVTDALQANGIAASEVQVVKDKFARANTVQRAVMNRRVYVKRGVLHDLLYGERQGLLRITVEMLQEDGKGLDLNDAFVQALTRHAGPEPSRKKRKRRGRVFSPSQVPDTET